MAFVTLETIFDYIASTLKEAFVYDPAALPVDVEGNPIWPERGLDWVKLFNGDPVEAVLRQVANIREGRYEAGVLIGLSNVGPGETSDSYGFEFANVLPVEIIFVQGTEGREDIELNARLIMRYHDDIYIKLQDVVTGVGAPNIFTVGVHYFQYNTSLALAGATNWQGIRFVYTLQRSATNE